MSDFSWKQINNKDELEYFYKSIMPRIKEAAKKCGYAIGVHGSLRRDLDLIAVPWIDECADKEILAREIHKAACGLESQSYNWENKPNGRIATCFPVCWTWHDKDAPPIFSNGHIDLSVTPNGNDTMRIEWMIHNFRRVTIRNGLWSVFPRGEKEYETPREAIDAAMKEKQ